MSPRTSRTPNRIEFLVLAVLADGPRHGYGIARDIKDRTRGEVSIRPGSLYRVLDRLVRRHLISRVDDGPSADDDRRNDYGITPHGREALLAEANLLASVANGVLSAGEEPA